ncbi:MAG: hypothetical protein COA83_08085 [Methylophaga sp.]|nr:MAG: hypothetical protein COA83_08085 [Methylophaga sp.]
MARTTSAKPSLIPAILALLVLILFGYILFSDLKPGSSTEHDINPPIEIIDTPPPLAIITQNEDILQKEQEAEAFVSQLAVATTEPIIVNENNNQFVRHDSIIVLPNGDEQTLAIKDIIQDGDMADDALFYVHNVTDRDVQGLWGIVQTGLINKFRQGLSIKGVSQNKDMLQAVIPANADEQLPSGLSSFLGKILSSKVDSSYIYNFNTKKMGRDSNVIHPGQQLVVIHFSPEELKQIYQFFSEQRNQETETFAITD